MSETTPEILQALAAHPRVTVRRDGAPKRGGKCVAYWMQRAQRGWDNHALDVAVEIGDALSLPVVAYFAGIARYPSANLRHYAFLNRGLIDLEEDLAERGIGFVLRLEPRQQLEAFLEDVDAAMLVGDENPIRQTELWRQSLATQLAIPYWTVDADVLVPSKLIEGPQYGAYTIRPRLSRMLPDFLEPFANARPAKEWKPPKALYTESPHEDMTRNWNDLDRSVAPVEDWVGGRHAAMKRLRRFTGKLLENYERDRTRPEIDGTSKMSPYLHFGHVGPLTIALAVDAAAKQDKRLQAARDAYFNELIVWRELAVNFVKHTPGYDTAACAENWAKKTIAEHARDQREYLYSLEQLESATTHDDLWNAAQTQMVQYGWMHNVMRMYWAKKILEWTPDVPSAVQRAVHLNDKYFLDGRDPNGYAGIAWAMVGKFDRAWFERPVFGKIRYMSRASTGRKFDSKLYIEQMQALRGEDFRLT